MSDRSMSKLWTQLAGYALVRVVTEPEEVALMLSQPPGKTPFRIRLHNPKSLELPTDLPPGGARITKVEMSGIGGGDESVAIEFADGQGLKCVCKRIIVDVF